MPRQIEAARLQYRARRFGSNVCLVHGGGGGATEGNRNTVKHGEFAAEALCVRTTGAKSRCAAAICESVRAVID
jgi:hypothetical protein